ncbi:MAG: hypothetical protein M1838_001009 [Thelocarpon superellum]|nr:MAG: hypothetical protein M1838_001009 [Thelocarpon superellum]
MSERELCLLSLDGGGVRGLSSLLILKQLMERIDPKSPPKPCDHFDMMAGTSTGGLIAIMLGRLRMTVDDCIRSYSTLAEEVFQQKYHRVGWKSNLQGRFDSARLDLVCATSQNSARCVRFTSYHSPRQLSDLTVVTKIWEAGRATSAASTFFDPIATRPHHKTFIDGATGANNPPAAEYGPFNQSIKYLISIETGVPLLEPFGNSLLEVAKALKNMAVESEATAEAFVQEHADLDDASRYFRLNVVSGLDRIGLEEYNQMANIVAATRQYVQSHAVVKQMKACAQNLGERESHFADATTHATALSLRGPMVLERYGENSQKLLDWLSSHDFTMAHMRLRTLRQEAGAGKTVLT